MMSAIHDWSVMTYDWHCWEGYKLQQQQQNRVDSKLTDLSFILCRFQDP